MVIINCYHNWFNFDLGLLNNELFLLSIYFVTLLILTFYGNSSFLFFLLQIGVLDIGSTDSAKHRFFDRSTVIVYMRINDVLSLQIRFIFSKYHSIMYMGRI